MAIVTCNYTAQVFSTSVLSLNVFGMAGLGNSAENLTSEGRESLGLNAKKYPRRATKAVSRRNRVTFGNANSEELAVLHFHSFSEEKIRSPVASEISNTLDNWQILNISLSLWNASIYIYPLMHPL